MPPSPGTEPELGVRGVVLLLATCSVFSFWLYCLASKGFLLLLLFLFLLYVCILILAILFYKITFFPLNNIIDSFKSNAILTFFFFTTFLQIILVANSYWFAHEPSTHIIFLLTSNHLLHQ